MVSTVAGRDREKNSCMTYMTGALMISTAFHSARFSGKMENRVCRTGV